MNRPLKPKKGLNTGLQLSILLMTRVAKIALSFRRSLLLKEKFTNYIKRFSQNDKPTIFAFWIFFVFFGIASVNAQESVVIGSKKFTESVILGDIAEHLAESNNLLADHKAELGGTRVLWNALLKGEIEVYPEYSGTIQQEILSKKKYQMHRH